MVARTSSPAPAAAGGRPLPVSATARQLLAARAAQDGTTFENRAADPAYVEALLRALRQRARDVARVRQRVVALRAENARRAAALGDAPGGPKKPARAIPEPCSNTSQAAALEIAANTKEDCHGVWVAEE